MLRNPISLTGSLSLISPKFMTRRPALTNCRLSYLEKKNHLIYDWKSPNWETFRFDKGSIPANIWKSEIRALSSFRAPPPPPPPSSADQTFWLHPVKRGRSKQIDCALQSVLKSTSHSYVRIGSIEGDFLSICRKRTWKNTRNRNVPILGSFETEKSEQSAGMRVEGGWKACICLCVCICVWVPFIMGSTHHRTVCWLLLITKKIMKSHAFAAALGLIYIFLQTCFAICQFNLPPNRTWVISLRIGGTRTGLWSHLQDCLWGDGKERYTSRKLREPLQLASSTTDDLAVRTWRYRGTSTEINLNTKNQFLRCGNSGPWPQLIQKRSERGHPYKGAQTGTAELGWGEHEPQILRCFANLPGWSFQHLKRVNKKVSCSSPWLGTRILCVFEVDFIWPKNVQACWRRVGVDQQRLIWYVCRLRDMVFSCRFER